MARRSNVIVIIGIAIFAVGAAATYFLVRDNGSSDAASTSGGTPVLVATQNIPAGTSGATALQNGLVKSKNVDQASKPPTALIDPSQLTGRTTTAGVPEGSVLTDELFPATQTRVGTVKIPPGLTALAVQMTNVPGVAGYVGADDHIDIYGMLKDGSAGHLIMQNVQVLSVNGATTTASPGLPGAADRVFLLAVSTAQAEQLSYLSQFHQLYFSLVPKDQAPGPGTPGVDPGNALKAA
jgi:Flp pilus assembly protein CpaB